MIRRATAVLVVGVLFAATTACSNGTTKIRLTVFAASSLSDSFSTIASMYERRHPDVQVIVSIGSSTTLAQQIVDGAQADVIATADQTSINIVRRHDDTAREPAEFATNTLTIAVPPGNPGHVSGVDSLSSASFVVCDPSAPCGAAAKQMLQNAGITAAPKSYEQDAASTLTKVETGDVDAGIVYVTDARAAGDKVTTIAIPAADNVTNPYFLATMKNSEHAGLALAWLALVQSPAGKSVLRKAGFGLP